MPRTARLYVGRHPCGRGTGLAAVPPESMVQLQVATVPIRVSLGARNGGIIGSRRRDRREMALEGLGELPTALDVLENSLGARPTSEQLLTLTIPELENLAGLLGELSDAQSDDKIPGGASLVGGWLGGFWSEPTLRADLGKSLLYYSNLQVLDPLADYFDDRSALADSRPIRVRRPDGAYNTFTAGPKMWSTQGSFLSLRDDPDRAAARFAAIVGNIYSLEGPLRRGVIVLRSQWPILARQTQALATSVRHDVRDEAMQNVASEPAVSGADALAVWDNLRGGAVTGGGDVHPSDMAWQNQHVFYYLAKTLAIADASGAQYVPSSERDLRLLRTKAQSAAGSAYPAAFLDEVARVVVPSFDIPIAQAVAMRESSEGFEDWRSKLDLIRRDGAADSPDDLRERVEDELRPLVREVERELRRSSSLAILDKSAADFIVSGGVAGSVAASTGGDVGATLVAGAASGISAWIRRAYGQGSSEGAGGVLAALVRGNRSSET